MQRRGAWVCATGLLIVGALLALAPAVGLERAQGVAAVLPARGGLTVAAVAALAVTGTACAWRRPRPVALPLALALAVVVALHAPVVVARGVTGEPVAAPGPGQLRVLEWNTNGPLVTPDVVAGLAAEQQADVVVLPQKALRQSASTYRRAFTDAGLPMQVLATPGYRVQVAVLLSPELAGHYSTQAGPDHDKAVVLHPDSDHLPTIVALHAPWPLGSWLATWRRDIDWVTSQCSSGARVVVAGDFNASIDDFGGPGLGSCVDAASVRDSAAVGSWSTWLPTLLAMPIDHVLATPAAGTVTSFTVITSQDRSGTRHRPTMTVITP